MAQPYTGSNYQQIIETTITAVLILTVIIQTYFPFMVTKFQIDLPKQYFVCHQETLPFKNASQWNQEEYENLTHFYAASFLGSAIGAILTQVKKVKVCLVVCSFATSVFLLGLTLCGYFTSKMHKWVSIGLGVLTSIIPPCGRVMSVNWNSEKFDEWYRWNPLSILLLTDALAILFWVFPYYGTVKAIDNSERIFTGFIITFAVIFLLIAVCFWTDSPRTNFKLKQEEIDYIIANNPNIEDTTFKLPLKVFKSPNTWIYFLLQIGSKWSLHVLYLVEFYLNYSLHSISQLSSYYHTEYAFLLPGFLLVYMYRSRQTRHNRIRKVIYFALCVLLSHVLPGFIFFSISTVLCHSSIMFSLIAILLFLTAFVVHPFLYFTFVMLTKHIGFISGIADALTYLCLMYIPKLFQSTIFNDETLEEWKHLFQLVSVIPFVTGFIAIVLIIVNRKEIKYGIKI